MPGRTGPSQKETRKAGSKAWSAFRKILKNLDAAGAHAQEMGYHQEGERRRKLKRASRNMSPRTRSALAKKGVEVHEDASISLPGPLTVDAETGRLRKKR